MGKKNNLIANHDPILSKSYKYQKRKNQRQIQKLKEQQLKQEENQKLKCLKDIQKSVQKQINDLYVKQVQKHKLMSLSLKKKQAIQKINFRAQKKENRPILTANNNQKNIRFLLKCNTPTYTFQNFQSSQKINKESSMNQQKIQNYIKHFISFDSLPEKITKQVIREKTMSVLEKIQTQIKNEIKDMFKVNQLEKKQNKKQKQMDQEKIQIQQNQNEPFVFKPKSFLKSQMEINILTNGLYQTQLNINSYSASNLVFQSPNSFLSLKKQEEMQDLLKKQIRNSMEIQQGQKYSNFQNKQKENSAQKNIIQTYKDYVHIQNKQEQTIQNFRTIVIKHMHNHYLNQQELSKSKENSFIKQKGFTMAKFLILAPYAGDAKAISQEIQNIFTSTQLNTNSDQMKKKQQFSQWSLQNSQKLEQLEDQNDFFRFGIKILSKKQKIYYFANFDTADIIVASPLGLKAIINSNSQKNKENSFLSSIEIMYIDRASVMLMQNWDHLLEVIKNLNYMPKYQSLKNSIDQIRQSTLEMKGRIYRQSIVFSQFQFPELNALKTNYFHNYEGCLTLRHIYLPTVLQNNHQIQKNFYKIELKEPKQDLNSRFQYFKRKFWEKIHNNENVDKIIVFVNSYFEYIKLKSFFQKVNASAQCICEHTKKQKIQSRLANFNNNKFRILLLTQRAFYFGLCQIKKFKQIYFYSLPKNSFIYKVLIQSIVSSSYVKNDNKKRNNSSQQNSLACVYSDQQNKVVCIYSKYDKSILQRIVGSVKASQMLRQYCSNVNFIV